MKKGASLSFCRQYRYSLWRIWDESKPRVLFICLNPSTADEKEDDPTIRRCISYCRSWGYGGFYIGNLFAFRATKPKDMKQAISPIGVCNDWYLKKLSLKCKIIVCGWGNDGGYMNRSSDVIKLLPHKLFYLKLNQNGEPTHPLFLKKNLKPQPYGY